MGKQPLPLMVIFVPSTAVIQEGLSTALNEIQSTKKNGNAAKTIAWPPCLQLSSPEPPATPMEAAQENPTLV